MATPEPATGAVRLARADLHASLSDPLMGAMSFLNEVMERYPQAISFAPGAPFAGFFDTLDVPRALERYARYLAEEHGLNQDQIRVVRIIF